MEIRLRLKQGLLVIAFATVSVIALLYGVSPGWFFATFLDSPIPPSVDQAHIMRAVMMLYLALGLFWLWSAFSDRYRDAGALVLCLFCGGLVLGRLVSVVVDGWPSPILVFYIVLELLMVPICLWLLRQPD
ncbi:DUF4345 domain-containing protein [Ferrimonas marina]|uniref:DUF4345 domain-containing protein n=1 Tax=Ferrimonas marina TaxID=299255 RepID=A0A1M5MJL2_9GAMM|nr:DUF4345 domain-containing protein [Ferrimonas marina]SHG77431.1 protein of unknown function [Ferrimonas marina]